MRPPFVRLGSLVVMILVVFLLGTLHVPSAYAATIIGDSSCLSVGTFVAGECRFYYPTPFNVASGDTVQLQVPFGASYGTNNGTIQVPSGISLDIWWFGTNNDTIKVASGASLIIEDRYTNNGTIISCGGTVSGAISGNPVIQQTCPIVNNDDYSTDEDTPLTIASPGVLQNDSDPENDLLTIVKESDPAHGMVALKSDGSFTYTPKPKYNGPDSFAYRASDGTTDWVATVFLTVNAVNDAPTETATPTETNMPTHTPVPPTNTATNTPTNTSVPPTSTPTNTSVPPTSTPTSTPTNTSVPPTVTSTSLPVQSTIVASADTYVQQKDAKKNFGSKKELIVDGTDDPREAYVRFTISGVAGTVRKAVLRLYVTEGTKDGPRLYQASNNTWTENGLTWNNRPGATGAVLGNLGNIKDKVWAEFDVIALVTGNGTYSVVLVGDSTDSIEFASRETSTKPQLVLTVQP